MGSLAGSNRPASIKNPAPACDKTVAMRGYIGRVDIAAGSIMVIAGGFSAGGMGCMGCELGREAVDIAGGSTGVFPPKPAVDGGIQRGRRPSGG